jgi:thiamine pyrophosphokinase
MLAHPIEAGQPFTALALNYYLPAFFDRLWAKAETRICADGGANRVFNWFGGQRFKNPELVVGDFDSLRPHVREFFERSGTKFEHIHDQDQNDLSKCLLTLEKNKIKSPIVVFGAFGGRFDQTIASFSGALVHSKQRLYFLDDNNFSTWIFPSDKGILCPQQWTTKVCGLLPISTPVRKVTTKGLKWDCDFGLQMNEFVSSSNEIATGFDRVLITTSDAILWTNQTKKFADLPL